MKKTTNLLLLLSLLLMTGCSGPGKIMNGWIGKTKEQLYNTWGQPERITPNGSAGVVLIYSAKVELYEPPGIYLSFEGDGYEKVNRPVQKTKQYTKLKLFFVNPAGIIYSWKMENI